MVVVTKACNAQTGFIHKIKKKPSNFARMDLKNFRKVNLSELQCLPSFEFFRQGVAFDGFLLEAHESYQKGGFRNRYLIKTSQGPLELSIPLQGGRGVRALIQDVKMDDRLPWRTNHLQSLETAYRSTPYYEYLAPEIKQIYRMPTDSLWNFNLELIRWAFSVLRWEKPIELTNSYQEYEPNGNVIDRRGIFKKQEEISFSILHYLFHFGPETALILENENYR